MSDFFDSLKERIEAISDLDGETYPTVAPEGAGLPHCVYVLLKKEDILAMDKPTGLATYTVQLHIVADTYADVVALTDRVKAALVAWPEVDERCLDVEWMEPAPEGFEPNWGVQRRSPVVSAMYYDEDVSESDTSNLKEE